VERAPAKNRFGQNVVGGVNSNPEIRNSWIKMSNAKAPSSNKIQISNEKIWQRRKILTLNHFGIHLSFGL
jgi:hypothetical protein